MDDKKKISANILPVVKNGLCTGCGTCVSMCPHDAIRIEKNAKKGVYVPIINNDMCNNCGVCLQVCPKYCENHEQFWQVNFKENPEDIIGCDNLCYVGHASNNTIRYGSSSGGLTTSILIFALEEGLIDGALITRMSKNNPLRPEPFIATTKAEIVEAAKSKYCPVPVNLALHEIMERDGKYAAVGLPCHIHGMRKAEAINPKLKDKIAFHVAIFCSGTPSLLATEYLLKKLKINCKDVHSFNYRGMGWPGKLFIRMNSGNTVCIPYPVYWSSFVDYFFLNACNSCLDWFGEYADISIGDAWISEITANDKLGTSVMISRNQNVDSMLSKMFTEKKVHITKINTRKLYESQQGFIRKKRRFLALRVMSKRSNEKYNEFYFNQLPTLCFADYMNAITSYFGTFFATHRSNWWLLDIYCIVKDIVQHIKSKLKD